MWLDHLLSREIEVTSQDVLKIASIPRSRAVEDINFIFLVNIRGSN